MTRTTRRTNGRIYACALIGVLACGGIVSVWTNPASAQGFFERLFGPLPGGGPFSNPEPQRPVDSSRAPAPRKSETPPTSTILVMGDSMADWLAYGLEEGLIDTPETGIIRKSRIGSGLIRFDARNEAIEWPQGARDLLAQEKPTYIVMMIGLNDRQAIRIGPRTGKPAPQQSEKPQGTDQEQETPDQPAADSQRKNTPGVYEFHTDQWEEIYMKRIDDTIAVLKSKNVPVFWIGLPALRTPKATSDVSYLNELFKARAEKAGIVYVDVWDGFVDEFGRFMQQGPDYEGQNRRLRANDGVHFTKAGARKLAHYIEREILRIAPVPVSPVALPEQQQQLTPGGKPGGPTVRPLAGPAVPLGAFAYAATNAGLDGTSSSAIRSELPQTTQITSVALVKGDALEAPAGRADDFAWPRRGVAPFNSDPVVIATTMPVPVAQLPPPPTAEAPSKTAAARGPALPGASLQQQQAARPQQRPTVFNPFSFLPFFR